jgi:hypothetical protein
MKKLLSVIVVLLGLAFVIVAYGGYYGGAGGGSSYLWIDDGLTTEMLVGGGTDVQPVWTTVTGTGAPMLGTSPTITTSLKMGNATDLQTALDTINHEFSISLYDVDSATRRDVLNCKNANDPECTIGANTVLGGIGVMTLESALNIGTGGVVITDDGDGTLILTGASAGNDEDLQFDFDNTADTVEIDSSTGVTKLLLTGIDLDATTPFFLSGSTPTTVSGNSGYYYNAIAGVIEFDLPADPTGTAFCFNSYTNAQVVTIDPNGTDVITLNGTAASAGEAIVSSGAVDEFICLHGVNTTTWISWGSKGTWAEATP